MSKKRVSDEQNAFALRQAEPGATLGETCRKMGVVETTFHRRKKACAGMVVSKISRLEQLKSRIRN